MNIEKRMLEVIEQDILPMTKSATDAGNKVFGAAVLRKDNLDLVIAGVNSETDNPLYHGEISCLNRFWAMPRENRPNPDDCLFLSTHEPCSMCLSAITWSGFDNFYYFFSYEDSKDSFNIPHDLKILTEVFNIQDGAYVEKNSYWQSYDLINLIKKSSGNEKRQLLERVTAIRAAYAEVSEVYQSGKVGSDIPLS